MKTNQVHANHAIHSTQMEQRVPAGDAWTKSKPTSLKISEETEAMQGMDHGKMNHHTMPGMISSDMTGAVQNSGHDMNHGGATPGKAGNMSSINHGSESMVMQGGSAPPDARNPHAYSDGYDFGPIPRPKMGDEEKFGALLIDRLESVTTSNNTFMTYDWQASYGQTYDRALVRAEGEIENGTFKNARNELLWAHAITAYLDSQLGVRYDTGQGTDRGWLAFGIQGLLPYWLYTEATAYVNEQGRVSFRFEAEYDLLLTQKLILQPRIEMNFYSRRDDTRNVSSGLSDIEGGLRLRYEVRRELAPYFGVEWTSRFGSAAGSSITASSNSANIYAEEIRFVAGVRIWF